MTKYLEELQAFTESVVDYELDEGAKEDAVTAMARKDPSSIPHLLGGAKGLVASLRKKAAKTNSPGATINRTAKLRSAAPPTPADAKPKTINVKMPSHIPPPTPADAKIKIKKAAPPPIPADAKKKPVGEASDLPMSKIQKDISLSAMKAKDPEALKNAMAGGKNLVMALRKKAAKERKTGTSIVNRHATSSPTQVRDPMDKKVKAESVGPVVETIVKQGSKFVIKSKDGKKRLGEYPTREQAVKRLGQIEFFKHQNEGMDLKLFYKLGMPKKEEFFIDEEVEEDLD